MSWPWYVDTLIADITIVAGKIQANISDRSKR